MSLPEFFGRLFYPAPLNVVYVVYVVYVVNVVKDLNVLNDFKALNSTKTPKKEGKTAGKC